MTDQRKYWLGFDLGGTKMLAQGYDEDWKIVGRERKQADQARVRGRWWN